MPQLKNFVNIFFVIQQTKLDKYYSTTMQFHLYHGKHTSFPLPQISDLGEGWGGGWRTTRFPLNL